MWGTLSKRHRASSALPTLSPHTGPLFGNFGRPLPMLGLQCGRSFWHIGAASGIPDLGAGFSHTVRITRPRCDDWHALVVRAIHIILRYFFTCMRHLACDLHQGKFQHDKADPKDHGRLLHGDLISDYVQCLIPKLSVEYVLHGQTPYSLAELS